VRCGVFNRSNEASRAITSGPDCLTSRAFQQSIQQALQSFVRFGTVVFSSVDRNLKDYLRIKEAAQFLGVSEGTLRNWGRQGKLRTHRHPINGYRLYQKADLELLLAAVHGTAKPAQGAAEPKVNSNSPRRSR
jgi:excisionase family DNA binding protein